MLALAAACTRLDNSEFAALVHLLISVYIASNSVVSHQQFTFLINWDIGTIDYLTELGMRKFSGVGCRLFLYAQELRIVDRSGYITCLVLSLVLRECCSCWVFSIADITDSTTRACILRRIRMWEFLN
jgi:hypothetical protein